MDDQHCPRRVLNYRATPDGRIASDIVQPCCVPVLQAAREGRTGAAHADYCPVFRYVGYEGDAVPTPLDDADASP